MAGSQSYLLQFQSLLDLGTPMQESAQVGPGIGWGTLEATGICVPEKEKRGRNREAWPII